MPLLHALNEFLVKKRLSSLLGSDLGSGPGPGPDDDDVVRENCYDDNCDHHDDDDIHHPVLVGCQNPIRTVLVTYAAEEVEVGVAISYSPLAVYHHLLCTVDDEQLIFQYYYCCCCCCCYMLVLMMMTTTMINTTKDVDVDSMLLLKYQLIPKE